MKKLVLILFGFVILMSSCGTDSSIKYDGNTTVNIVLLEEYKLNATSDIELTYHSDNEMFVTVDNNGNIVGKNVGEANVTISNAENSIVIKVVVSLFEEPTFDFGSSPNDIINIYGNPKRNYGDTIFVYGSGNDWYSYAVWEMDFFFKNNRYIESDLYIRNDLTLRINEFLDSKYYFQNEINDTIDDVITTYYIYLNAEEAVDANVLIGKIYNADTYGDICLFYLPYSHEEKYNFKDIIRRNRKEHGIRD